MFIKEKVLYNTMETIQLENKNRWLELIQRGYDGK